MATKKLFRGDVPPAVMWAMILAAYGWALLGWLFIFAAQEATGLVALGCWALFVAWVLTVIWLLKS